MDRIQIMGGLSDRDQARGKRYPFTRLNDETGQHERVTQFDSMDDVQEAMSMKDANGRDLYSTDAAYRETVKEIIANSPQFMAEDSLSYKNPIPTDEVFLEGLRQDAIKQRREELIDEAGGNNAIAKYNLALAMINPEFAESAYEMQGRTESARPWEDMLKARAANGEGPLQFSVPTEDLPQEKTLEQCAAEMTQDNSFIITTEGE